MTAVLAILLVLLVAAFVISPLLWGDSDERLEHGGGRGELWRREKAVAVLAITEADFDRATGKLSDDDYRVLRSDYEGRALVAMDEIEKLVPAVTAATTAAGTIRFCPGCGTRFAETHAFCGSCGRPRDHA